ncbi:MAG: DUF4298 domain-containing protein [Bacteroidales bacterium]|nr:DUF4298 domain-containing protein [Bacteroidales bacterium]
MEIKEFTLQRIAAMEAAFDRTSEAVKALSAALDQYETVKVDISRLTDYLDTGAWREDFEADEEGLVPAIVKRGVLSEDALYNLLGDIVSLHEQMQEICGD